MNGKTKSSKGNNRKETDDPCFSKFIQLSTPFVRGEMGLKWSEWSVTSVQKNSDFCLLKDIFSSFSVFTVAHFYFSVLSWLRSCDKTANNIHGPQVGQREDNFNSFFKVYGTNYTLDQKEKKGSTPARTLSEQGQSSTNKKPLSSLLQDDVY